MYRTEYEIMEDSLEAQRQIDADGDWLKILQDVSHRLKDQAFSLKLKADSFLNTGNEIMADYLYFKSEQLSLQATRISNAIDYNLDRALKDSREMSAAMLNTAMTIGTLLEEKIEKKSKKA